MRAIGILAGISMDIPQMDKYYKPSFEPIFPLAFPIPQWAWKANEKSLKGE